MVASLLVVSAAHAGRRYDTARHLNHVLDGTPMGHLGYELEAVGWKYHVHPAFMAAVAAKESSLGVAACPGNRFNVWGLGSCGSAWTPPNFGCRYLVVRLAPRKVICIPLPARVAWHRAITYFARFIRRTWPHARTPWELYGYAADVQGSWAPGVAGWMRSWGFAPVVSYGRG